MTLVILETTAFETDAEGQPIEGSTSTEADPQTTVLRAIVRKGAEAERRLAVVEAVEDDFFHRWRRFRGDAA